MQPQTSQCLIVQQHDAVKCNQCDLYYGKKGKTDFYICCYPFKISKILCEKNRNLAKCDQCHTLKANIPINLSELDRKYLRNIAIPEEKKFPQHIVIKTGYQCWICNCVFSYSTQTYLHQKCQKRYCYPCLYLVYSLQLQMFDRKDVDLKKKYKMVMVCCKEQGEPIHNYEKLFSESICVFRGCQSSFNNSMVKIKNRISYCVPCLNQVIDGQLTDSIGALIEQIFAIQPKKCLYCEKRFQSVQLADQKRRNALNAGLCVECYPKKGQTFSEAIGLLKIYKPSLVEKVNQDCYCCGQKIEEVLKKDKKQNEVRYPPDIKLVYWKDGNKYCGGCLYKKYQKYRINFQTKSTKILPEDKEIFAVIKQCYQRHFIDKCMICSRSQTYENKLYKVPEGKQKDKHKLNCNYCSSCEEYIKTDYKRFKQLLDMKAEISKRMDFEFDEFKEKDVEKKKKNKVFVDQVGCLSGLFPKNAKLVEARAQNNLKPQKSSKIMTHKKFHEQFLQFKEKPTQGDEQDFLTPQSEQQYYQQNAIEHQDKQNTSSREVKEARICIQSKEKQYPQNDMPNRWSDDMIKCVKLKTFDSMEYMEQMKKKSAHQKKPKGEEQVNINSSTYFSEALINSGLIEELQGKNFASRIQTGPNQMLQTITLPKQRCKVFSCTNLTGVMSETHQYPSQKQYLNPKYQQKEQPNQGNDSPLMLGLMCSDCFVRYLLGLVRQEDIDRKDWDQAMRENAYLRNKIDEFIE